MKLISIIIINYNTAKLTLKCIKSISDYTKKEINYEIVIVDNNSELDDYFHLKNNLPKTPNITLQRSIINTGFGGGNMFGAQFCNSEYILFLNNDAFFTNDCLSIMYDYMKSNPETGVCTAQNYDENNKSVPSFDHFKGIRKLLFGRSFLEKFSKKNHPKRSKNYSSPIHVDFVNGAFMFFKSEVFAKSGGFDTNIFLYFEEMDICYRLKKLGYKSTLIPKAKITHYQGSSTSKNIQTKKEGLISHMYVINKNYGTLKYLFIKHYYCVTFLFKIKKWNLLPIVFRGISLSKSIKSEQQITFLKHNSQC